MVPVIMGQHDLADGFQGNIEPPQVFNEHLSIRTRVKEYLFNPIVNDSAHAPGRHKAFYQ